MSTLIDHLSGAAKEEILCAPAEERNTYAKIVSLLRSRFGPLESVSTLTSALYARVQLDGESLADFSRALMRLHDRMEQASAGPERAALRLLRDGVLKEQFVKGTKEVSVRRELRRILVEKPDLAFFNFREHALALFPEADDISARRNKVRSALTSANDEQVNVQAAAACPVTDPRSELVASNKLILEKLDALTQAQSVTASQIQNLTAVLTQKLDAAISSRTDRQFMTCNYCKKPGHFARNCRRRQAIEATHQDRPNQGTPENSTPPS